MANRKPPPTPGSKSRENSREAKPFKIHWLIKGAGYTAIVYLGFLIGAMFTGNWLGIEQIHPFAKVVAGTAGVGAWFLALGCWKLADTIGQ